MIALFRRVPSWIGRDVFLPFAATRLALTLIAWLAFHLLPLPSAFPLAWEIGRSGAVQYTGSGAPQAHPFINMWSRWDAGWYLQIAKEGYGYERGKPASVAFFPLYPLAIRLLHGLLLLPSSDHFYLAVGILLSNICAIGGLTFLHALVSLDYTPGVARRTVLILLLFPTSFFLSAAYSESFFFVLIVASFYYARRQRWFVACLLAGLTTLCRSQGIMLIAPLLAEYLAHKKWRSISGEVLNLLIIPGALLGFVFYLRWSFGSWSILFHAQQPWGRRLLAPWHTLPWVLTHASVSAGVKNDWIDLTFFILLLILTILFSRHLRASYTVYLWLAVLFFSSWGMLGSVPRFVLVVFPLFICLALLCEKDRTFRLAYLTVSSVAGAILFVMYSQWQWVA